VTRTRTKEFEQLRPLLYAIAHRILGSANDADDAVQETWLRWADTPTPPTSIESHLAAEVTRISTDTLRSTRLYQERHLGPWPTEPMTVPADQDPDHPTELSDSLLTAALLVLERLSPLERAVFVLREAFGCTVPEIAETIGCSEEACAQLVASIAVTSDGGRESLPWPTYIAGSTNVARLLAAIVPPLTSIGITLEQRLVNGRPGTVFRARTGRILNALALHVSEGQIQEVHLVINPGDPTLPDPVAEAYAILHEANRST
jgi:RNA polymerase sigma-70 factor (ECF subfamily)